MIRTLLAATITVASLLALSTPDALAQVAVEYGAIGAGSASRVIGQQRDGGAAGAGQSGGTPTGTVNPAGSRNSTQNLPPWSSAGPVEMSEEMMLTIGKSTLLRLPAPIDRVSVGNPAIADVVLLSGRELYLLGKGFGTTNVMLWRKGGATTVLDVSVRIDELALTTQLKSILPNEQIAVRSSADSLVLSGTASGPLAAKEAVEIAESYIRQFSRSVVSGLATDGTSGGLSMSVSTAPGQSQIVQSVVPRVINLLRIEQPAQVMLEVKVAEISKTLLDRLGSEMNLYKTDGNWTYGILNSLLTESGASLFGASIAGKRFGLDGENRDGLVKILAEPNIIAISGQEASFLAGGKIFIPVARNAAGLGVTITLEEKEFGIGLKFLPNVLDGGRINLRVSPEVSELSQTGNPFTTVGGVTTVLPSFTVRRAQTTVQLMDGQSLAIAGLIKNNVKETLRKMPVLGELPILGALFRSSEFQTDRTELMFLITPRLVKPLTSQTPRLPTDAFVPPSTAEFYGTGALEGSGNRDIPADGAPRAPALPTTQLEVR